MPIVNQSVFALLLYLVPIVGTSLAQPVPDVRNVRWGYRPRQVREAETAKPNSIKKEKIIYTQIPLADRKVGLEYEFNGDSLLSASYYYYTTASVTKEDVLAASATFESKLTETYGRGKTSRLGDTRNVVWLTPRTQISLSTGNVDRGWSVEIVYLCRVCSGQPLSPEQSKTLVKPHNEGF